MLITASFGLCSNIIILKVLGHAHVDGSSEEHGHSHSASGSMNAAVLHVIGDILQNVGVFVASLMV